MRRYRVTIRALAHRMQITQQRVRNVRAQGLRDPQVIRDWKEAITGVDPGAAKHQMQGLEAVLQTLKLVDFAQRQLSLFPGPEALSPP